MSSCQAFQHLSFDPETGQVFAAINAGTPDEHKIVLNAEDREVPFAIKIVESKESDFVETQFRIGKKKLQQTFHDHQCLDGHWPATWPKLLDAFADIRKEYGSPAPITSSNSCFTLSGPGSVDGCLWIMELEIEPWDGFFQRGICGNRRDIDQQRDILTHEERYTLSPGTQGAESERLPIKIQQARDQANLRPLPGTDCTESPGLQRPAQACSRIAESSKLDFPAELLLRLNRQKARLQNIELPRRRARSSECWLNGEKSPCMPNLDLQSILSTRARKQDASQR